MLVAEWFYSLQGESTYSGLSCIFVRLAGCNLKCPWCDTNYAQRTDQGTEMPVEEVAQKVVDMHEESSCELVEITGGEPLLQMAEVAELCELLHDEIGHNLMILIETNGSINLENLITSAKYTTIIMDIKTPSSGMTANNCLDNLALLSWDDEVKFVVGSQEDLKYMTDILAKYETPAQILVSPIWGGELTWGEIAEYVKTNHPTVRMQLQLHKLIWEPEQRGV